MEKSSKYRNPLYITFATMRDTITQDYILATITEIVLPVFSRWPVLKALHY